MDLNGRCVAIRLAIFATLAKMCRHDKVSSILIDQYCQIIADVCRQIAHSVLFDLSNRLSHNIMI